jgi:hypothetical protein
MGQRDGSAAVENFFFVVMCTSIGTLVMGFALVVVSRGWF